MSAREILLEQVQARTEWQRDTLLRAFELLHTGSCYCDVAIGNPMLSGEHSDACKRVTAMLADVRQSMNPVSR